MAQLQTKKNTKKEVKVSESKKKLKLNLSDNSNNLDNLSFSSISSKKSQTKKKALIIFALVIVALMLFYFKNLFIAATVNGEVITRLSIIRELEKRSGKTAVENVITEKLIFQEASKNKIAISNEEIDSEIKIIEENLKNQGQTLDQVLSLQGLSLEELKKQIKLQLSVEKLLSSRITVTQEEITDYIAKNKDFLSKDKSEDEQKAEVEKLIKQDKLSAEFEKWLTEVKSAAKINYFINY